VVRVPGCEPVRLAHVDDVVRGPRIGAIDRQAEVPLALPRHLIPRRFEYARDVGLRRQERLLRIASWGTRETVITREYQGVIDPGLSGVGAGKQRCPAG